MKEVYFYQQLANKKVQCGICPHRCIVAEDGFGVCKVRENIDGKLYARNYGQYAALALDPIEKKPLYHFYPGATILSIGALGCNFTCEFCQNWELARATAATKAISSRRLVELATTAAIEGCIGIAYTYSEPLMWYEFVFDTAQLARERGLKNVLVSNGYIEPEPLAKLLPYLDAVNIDVKAFQSEFYRRLCGARLEPVLNTVEKCVRAGCHVELTTLLIPGWNDSGAEIGQLVAWVASLDPAIPLHFSRYFPHHKFTLPPTPLKTLRLAWELAKEKLAYVYLGNVEAGEGSHTYCPACGQEVIRRYGYQVEISEMTGNCCRSCGEKLAIYL
ncbi:MAG: AmmeMemoRadiSam system radical SAM enzyme [bacterium]|jgi:pyruvate formate lyase activating enzyme